MTALIIMVFVNTLAFWQKDMILFFVSGIVTILVAFDLIDDYAGISIILCGLGVYQVLKAVIMALEAGGGSKGWSQFKGFYNRMRSRGGGE